MCVRMHKASGKISQSFWIFEFFENIIRPFWPLLQERKKERRVGVKRREKTKSSLIFREAHNPNLAPFRPHRHPFSLFSFPRNPQNVKQAPGRTIITTATKNDHSSSTHIFVVMSKHCKRNIISRRIANRNFRPIKVSLHLYLLI